MLWVWTVLRFPFFFFISPLSSLLIYMKSDIIQGLWYLVRFQLGAICGQFHLESSESSPLDNPEDVALSIFCLLLVYFLKKRRWRVILTTGLYAMSPHSPSKPKTQEESSTFTDFHWSAQLSNTLYWMGNEWGAEKTSRLIDFNFLKQLSWCGFELLFANLQHPKTATNVLSR